jgi:hypothetical protein
MGEPAMAEDTDVTDDAIADVPAADTPASEVDPLDALLAEFESATQGTAPKPAFDPDESARAANEAFAEHFRAAKESLAIDQRSAELDAAQQQLLLERHQRDLADAVQEIRGELDQRFFDDQFVTTWLDSRASSDQRLQQLWLERGQNPQAARAAINKLASEFQEKFRRLPDPQVTEDHEAIAQAVRGSGKAPPERSPDLSKMSNRELQKYTQDNWGFS